MLCGFPICDYDKDGNILFRGAYQDDKRHGRGTEFLAVDGMQWELRDIWEKGERREQRNMASIMIRAPHICTDCKRPGVVIMTLTKGGKCKKQFGCASNRL